MYPSNFRYHRAESFEQACDMLATLGPDARPMAIVEMADIRVRAARGDLLRRLTTVRDSPSVAEIEAIVQEVLAAARPVEETAVPRRAALRAGLVVVEAEIARLTSAIARAPDLGSLLDALRAKEQYRTALQAELTALDGLGRVRMLDAATLTPAIVAKLGDWAGLMGRKVGQARQILRHVLDGRITFTPQADGLVAFVGYASIGPLVAGTVLADLSKTVVSPTGYRLVRRCFQ